MELVWVNGAPPSLQAVGAAGDPNFTFHRYTVCPYSTRHKLMHATIYRLRRQNELLDRAAMMADAVTGELRVRRRGFNNRTAMLLAEDGETYLAPVLDKARLLEMDERGILLSGIEWLPPRGAKGNGTHYRQTWWCLIRAERAAVSSAAQGRAIRDDWEARQIAAVFNRWPTRRSR